MDEYNEIYGVDISKDVFDVQNSKGDYFQLTNDEKGFKNFVKKKAIRRLPNCYGSYWLLSLLFSAISL